MKLQLRSVEYYRVKRGQRLCDVARAYLVPPRVLAAENHLESEPEEGQILRIPPQAGDLYLVKGGESKSLLCGSPEKFEEKNRTRLLYPGQIVWL